MCLRVRLMQQHLVFAEEFTASLLVLLVLLAPELYPFSASPLAPATEEETLNPRP